MWTVAEEASSLHSTHSRGLAQLRGFAWNALEKSSQCFGGEKSILCAKAEWLKSVISDRYFSNYGTGAKETSKVPKSSASGIKVSPYDWYILDY